MKLRIKGNSIRLRLTQTECRQIGAGQAIREEVGFGTAPLAYALRTDTMIGTPRADFREGEIQVWLPTTQASQWVFSDQVGIETYVTGSRGQQLHLLIEKDFQCLHKRPDEDESDHFSNPAAMRV